MLLSVNSGYRAVYEFLDRYWRLTLDEELACLLSSMDPTIPSDGMPIDETHVLNWIEYIKKGDMLKEEFTAIECFDAMIGFVNHQISGMGLYAPKMFYFCI
jgi:CRISPR/Cas system CSM-associated protein Csm5 (group 7 of RAMP superfamily)